MRPLELVMSAFGPYVNETKLNMDSLGTSGLYLITGDTGAGKTMIFDAITYALFGEASGNLRMSESLRSKYASPDTDTYVSLKFVLHNKEYKIIRTPEYLRPSKRGKDRFVTKQASAELTLPDGNVLSGVTNVTRTVEKLMGINKAQFTQIAMIAQGDFLSLLNAKTKERVQIFREIFNTGAYTALQDALKKMAQNLYHNIETLKKEIVQQINMVNCGNESPYLNELSYIKENAMTLSADTVIEFIEKLCLNDNDELYVLNTKIADTDNIIAKLDKSIGIYSQTEKINSELINLKSDILIYADKQKHCKELYEKELLNSKLREALATQISTKTDDLYKYDQYDKLIIESKKLENAINELQKNIEEQKKNETNLKISHNEYLHEAELIKNCAIEAEKVSFNIKNLHDLSLKADNLLINIKSHTQLMDDLAEYDRQYILASREYDNQVQLCSSMEKAYYDGQAGILSSKLITDMPCPVCGSTHHPDPAMMPDSMPLENDIKKQKQILEQKATKRSELSSAAGITRGRAETNYFKLIEENKDFISKYLSLNENLIDKTDIYTADNKFNTQTDIKDMEAAINIIRPKIEFYKSQVEKILKQLRSKLYTLEKNKERYTNLSAMAAKCDSEIKKLSESSLILEKQVLLKKTNLNNIKLNAKDLKKDLTCSSKAEATAAIETIKHKKAALDHSFNTAKKAFDDANVKYLTTAQRIKDLSEQLEALKNDTQNYTSDETDLESLKQLRADNVLVKNELFNQKDELNLRLSTNKRAALHIKDTSLKMGEDEKKWQCAKALSDTANATLTGKDKIMLETYVLTAFFDVILSRANIKLMAMTNGQYELKRCDDTSGYKKQSGLDLEVIDHYNASHRSVSTLSGGESFMASLSLALGLADEIQSESGGIRIDTMFVDEGFGTLDDEALEQALKVLLNLSASDKLVGIISHVASFKEKIDKQIVVTKNRNGGSEAFIIS